VLNRHSWKKSGRRSIVSLTRVRRGLDHFRKEGAKLVPEPTAPWEWSCGFHPGSRPGEHQSDTAATFEDARADFERAWRKVAWVSILSAKRLTTLGTAPRLCNGGQGGTVQAECTANDPIQ
jgi:hypothetical protein